ncbi:predicted protein [Verticillium alfalfae VaMs.102]|uniref:Predicted protein n=1 Tax=Verticillium alfalfae (strain VaMs.102 / ATCC MYA-4576 / FGSC 10136) TaxID=526221 RepID=C9SN82_VERA1|nr:predicted protein [Verticillium alfalfae VaMs.102]EEY20247.1 predicted protein [Verticillium alfalfae VaMs.102]
MSSGKRWDKILLPQNQADRRKLRLAVRLRSIRGPSDDVLRHLLREAVRHKVPTYGTQASHGPPTPPSYPALPGEPSINLWLSIIISRLVDRHLSRLRPLVIQCHTDDQVPAKGVQLWRLARPDRKTVSPSERRMRMYYFACAQQPVSRKTRIRLTQVYLMDLQNSVQEAEHRRQRRDSRGSPIGERAGQRSNEEEISSSVNGTVQQQEAAGGPSNTYATPRSEDIGFQAPALQESPDHTEPASLAVENPLSLRHAEFTTSAAGVTCESSRLAPPLAIRHDSDSQITWAPLPTGPSLAAF